MMKNQDLFSVVLRGYFSPCIGQVTSKGGQEAKRGYLLLGVYHRRIPGYTDVNFISYFLFIGTVCFMTCYVLKVYFHVKCKLFVGNF